jgi:hypothetical protein
VATVRTACPFLTRDQPLGEAIESVAAMVLAGRFRPGLPDDAPRTISPA